MLIWVGSVAGRMVNEWVVVAGDSVADAASSSVE